jgi:hypothetical protein
MKMPEHSPADALQVAAEILRDAFPSAHCPSRIAELKAYVLVRAAEENVEPTSAAYSIIVSIANEFIAIQEEYLDAEAEVASAVSQGRVH